MTAQSVFIIAAFLAVFWRISVMSAALDRLTASVDAAVAKIASEPVADDAALNALADKLDAAVAGPSSPAAPADQTPPAFG